RNFATSGSIDCASNFAGARKGAAPLAPPLDRTVVLLSLPRPQTNSFILGFSFMQFNVGDIVHNKITREEGRIVRIADLPGHGLCYIVSVIPGAIWGTAEKEAIWKRSDVSD